MNSLFLFVLCLFYVSLLTFFAYPQYNIVKQLRRSRKGGDKTALS
jgi:hypothetical protein